MWKYFKLLNVWKMTEEAATTSRTKLEKKPNKPVLEGPSKAIIKNESLESGAYWVYFYLKQGGQCS